MEFRTGNDTSHPQIVTHLTQLNLMMSLLICFDLVYDETLGTFHFCSNNTI